ncbi:MAG: hypothetical protein H6Q73_4491 [Firmicutes bacterium]|nr:hypothetical protein [Bacillota bacterium]
MKAKISVCCLVVLLMLICSTTFAEKSEWVDKSYNFSNIKTVLIVDPAIPNEIKNGITENEIKDIFKEKAVLPKVKVVYLSDLCKILNIRMDANSTISPEDLKFIINNTSQYADVAITSTVTNYGTGSEYREGYSYNTTTYKTSYIHSKNGTTTIETPVTETHNVSGGNIPVAYTTVRWDVYETSAGKPIFSRIESRSRASNTLFDNTKPRDLYERITKAFFNDLNHKLKKNK